ncbi:hypothetical protein BDV12DRAFT_168165 [Aspergillus spectabilis]
MVGFLGWAWAFFIFIFSFFFFFSFFALPSSAIPISKFEGPQSLYVCFTFRGESFGATHSSGWFFFFFSMSIFPLPSSLLYLTFLFVAIYLPFISHTVIFMFFPGFSRWSAVPLSLLHPSR